MNEQVFFIISACIISTMATIHFIIHIPFLKTESRKAKIVSTFSVSSKVQEVGVRYLHGGVEYSGHVPVRNGDPEIRISDRGRSIDVWTLPSKGKKYYLSKPNYSALMKDSYSFSGRLLPRFCVVYLTWVAVRYFFEAIA